MVFDIDLIVPDKTKSIKEGAIAPWGKLDNFHIMNTLIALAEQFGVDIENLLRNLTKKVDRLFSMVRKSR